MNKTLLPCTNTGNVSISVITHAHNLPMASVILCVPNFSEGRKQNVVDAISKSISDSPGCYLLDVSAGHSTNRTVYTFAGAPEAVVLGALNSAKVAYGLIDMSVHEGGWMGL